MSRTWKDVKDSVRLRKKSEDGGVRGWRRGKTVVARSSFTPVSTLTPTGRALCWSRYAYWTIPVFETLPESTDSFWGSFAVRVPGGFMVYRGERSFSGDYSARLVFVDDDGRPLGGFWSERPREGIGKFPLVSDVAILFEDDVHLRSSRLENVEWVRRDNVEKDVPRKPVGKRAKTRREMSELTKVSNSFDVDDYPW